MLEFVFNGTGTSSSLPSIKCLTDPNTTCPTCPSTLTPEGKKNIRRNTGAIIRKRVMQDVQNSTSNATEEKDIVIVIDVGKTFLASALEWFPKYGFRKIDAILLTHAHADAINGLDDLRSWTLRGSIQSHIDIYASLTCFNEIKRAFPYLVSKDFATGGGDVPEFRWHIIKENETFEIEGAFWITPVAVDHGRQFPTRTAPLPGLLGLLTPLQQSTPIPSGQCTPTNIPLHPGTPTQKQSTVDTPFKCFGFIINATILYLSDVSHIPEDEWNVILHPPPKPLPSSSSSNPPSQPRTPESDKMPSLPTASYSVLVIDVLKPPPHISHFGIAQAVTAARRIGAKRSYMVGFDHMLNHDHWVAVGEALGRDSAENSQEDIPDIVRDAVELVEPGAPLWLRPGFDGMRIFVPEPGDKDQKLDDGYTLIGL